MDGPAPAIFNAVADATGIDPTRLPLTPEVADGARRRPRVSDADDPGRTAASTAPTVARGPPDGAAARRPAPRPRPHRHEGGLRRRRVRRVLGPRRRPARQQLPVPLAQAAGTAITTIEGVANGDRLHAVQQAFITHGGAQCGICTPGMVLAAVTLLARTAEPSEADIRQALGRKPLPLHRLHADFRSRAPGVREGCAGAMRSYLPAYDLRVAGEPGRGAGAPRRARTPVARVRRRHRPDGAARGGKARRTAATSACGRWTALRGIVVSEGEVVLGALTTYAEVLASDVLQRGVSAASAPPRARPAASPRRTAARIGGNIANASPAADTPPALLVYDAVLDVQLGPRHAARAVRGVPHRLQDDGPGRGRADRVRAAAARRGAGRTSAIARSAPAARRRSRRCVLPGRSRWRTASSPTSGSPSAAWRRPRCGRWPPRPPCGAGRWTLRQSRRPRSALADDIAPIDDMRSSSRYRAAVAGNLLEAFLSRSRGRPMTGSRSSGDVRRCLVLSCQRLQ